MTECWMEAPDERPNFTQIRERLEVIIQKDNPYLDLSLLDESRDYYNVPSFNSLVDEDDEVRGEDESDVVAFREQSDGISVNIDAIEMTVNRPATETIETVL